MPLKKADAPKGNECFSGIQPISMRVNDACRYTGIGRSTLYILIAQGEIEIIKLGTSTLVLTESLNRYIENKRHPLS